MDAISRLLQPRSVAVIGASADPTKTAGRPVAYLQKHGFAGADLCRSTRKADRIGDLPCYPDIASLPVVPDVGIVLLGAERAHLAVRDLAARGTAAAIVLASGYTETGEDGARRQRQLIEAAGSMRILGPEHHRPGEPHRQHRAVGHRRAGDGPLPGRRASASSRKAAASSARCCRAPRRAASACPS